MSDPSASTTTAHPSATAADVEPTTAYVLVKIEPFLMRTGVAFRGDVQALAEQLTRYVAENLSARFTADHADAGLVVAVSVKRGAEAGGHLYTEGPAAPAAEQEGDGDV